MTFISWLARQREILNIDIGIDPALEIAALTHRVCRMGGPALGFAPIVGSETRVVTNLFGSERRMAAALGHESLVDFGARLDSELGCYPASNSARSLCRLSAAAEITKQSSRLIQRPDLSFLPQFRFWAAEQRAFFTLAVVVTRDPHSKQQNYGIYRLGLVDNTHFALNLLPASGGAKHLQQWQQRGEKMPVAILLGADPALIFAAAASLPTDCDEAYFSSWIQDRPIEMVTGQTLPLSYPVSAQVVIEGWIDSAQTINEGPFGCFTGAYGGNNLCPLLEVSSVASAERPLIPQTLAGPLPMEDSWLARANLEFLMARLRIDLPQIKSLQMPLDAVFFGLYFASVEGDRLCAAELAAELRKLDYFKHLKMLVMLEEGENLETDWRLQVQRQAKDSIWKEDSLRLEALLCRRPAVLQHDPAVLDSVLQRLMQAGFNLERLSGGR
ncbi:MAG: UbiD family decarboxylase [Geopsychrobacter sp.]|nr:UbiD family decarboxylase [Geopsychrobacter sp.]